MNKLNPSLAGPKILAWLIGVCLTASPPANTAESPLAILETQCLECHGGKTAKSGLNLATREGLLRGGDSGKPAVVPGHATASLLYRKITHTDEPGMPYRRDKLSPAAIATLAEWINKGAVYDRSLAVPQKAGLWSLQPLRKPLVPPLRTVAERNWARNSIDHFILEKLREKKLKPNPPADKRTLLRRVSFDLIGLPPTPDEMNQFLRDKSADAYERAVDRLLNSPRHGERWARHWMDVVHFAETHGHDQDRIRTNAWPYRDYLVRSFNSDKPYARFVEEQLAGDILFPDSPEAIVATGFIATGPWDESSLLNIMEDTVDKKIARYLDRDDMVTTAMSTFVSLTVHCARCHDHKFDPITQEDYYSLQAVFAGVDKADRPFDVDPEVNLMRQQLLKARTALDVRDESVLAELRSERAQAEVASWEAELNSRPSIWTVLEPVRVNSSNGTAFMAQPDGSHLATGSTPERDTYTIVAETRLQQITAVRLEVLTDDTLPKKGPGRQDNGNLHLSEFRVEAASLDAGANQPVPLQNPSADFNQQSWTIAHAIDGKTNTAWGIYPEVGKPHFAVFETKENLGFKNGTRLTFTLDQWHGQSHLIGRFRLSITTAPRPVSAMPQPEAISKVLAIEPGQRSDEQRRELAAFVKRQQIERKLKELPAPQWVYAAANDFTPDNNFTPAKKPRPVHLLKRGDIHRPGDMAQPGALACVSDLPARFSLARPDEEGERRAALARWITDRKNPLTWRSIVNRVWQYHFGRGLVETANDFGEMGAQPTHPELLDWLAATFLESGGSLKKLHRLIVTSAAYRQSAAWQEEFARKDADNLFLWRMNRTRLDAECVRDAVLQITGRLDLTMGGPSAQQFKLSAGIHVTPNVDYAAFDVDSAAASRRSVYRFIFRTLPDPFMDSLDCADASQLTARRNTSVTALQALSMMNNAFMVRQSEHFAARLEASRRGLEPQIELAYELALGRPPRKGEVRALAEYARKHGLANTCRLILNSNEFLFAN